LKYFKRQSQLISFQLAFLEDLLEFEEVSGKAFDLSYQLLLTNEIVKIGKNTIALLSYSLPSDTGYGIIDIEMNPKFSGINLEPQIVEVISHRLNEVNEFSVV